MITFWGTHFSILYKAFYGICLSNNLPSIHLILRGQDNSGLRKGLSVCSMLRGGKSKVHSLSQPFNGHGINRTWAPSNLLKRNYLLADFTSYSLSISKEKEALTSGICESIHNDYLKISRYTFTCVAHILLTFLTQC